MSYTATVRHSPIHSWAQNSWDVGQRNVSFPPPLPPQHQGAALRLASPAATHKGIPPPQSLTQGSRPTLPAWLTLNPTPDTLRTHRMLHRTTSHPKTTVRGRQAGSWSTLGRQGAIKKNIRHGAPGRNQTGAGTSPAWSHWNNYFNDSSTKSPGRTLRSQLTR